MYIKTTEYSNNKPNHTGSIVLAVITVVTIVACFVQITRVI